VRRVKELATGVVHGTEVAYAVIVLLALTQGPVYRLWTESGQYQQFIALPTIGHAYFATFVAVQLPALCLVARRLSATFIAERRGQVLMALLLWLGLSVLWSTLARHSLPEFVSLLLTTMLWYLPGGEFPASRALENCRWRDVTWTRDLVDCHSA